MKNSLEKYKQFRRIYPKPRLSYSLWRYWIKNDWVNVWAYLCDFGGPGNPKQQTGKRVHECIEKNGAPKELIKKIPSLEYEVVRDIETKLEIEAKDYFVVGKPDEFFLYRTHGAKFNDLVIIDYKHGAVKGYEKQLNLYAWLIQQTFRSEFASMTGYIIEIKSKWNNGEIAELSIGRTKQYQLQQKWMNEWELIFEEMVQSILLSIEMGYLDKFLKDVGA